MCRRLILVCFSFLCFLTASAQDFKSEADLKKKAEELFDQGDYVSANPLFSQLLSLYPKDPNYNFKFGVCLLYTTENKEKPLTYLEFAAKKPETEKEVFFFLGRAYHLNYRFSDAVTAYENFKKNGNPKTFKKFEVDQHILMCRNGISLLKNVKDLFVLEKKSMKEEDFFRAYNTDGLKGRLVVKPDEFKTPVDRKKKETSVMFIAQGSEELYFSSYGPDDKNGKDLFKCKKLPSGEWGPPQSLGLAINTPYDEDYPYLHADGKTLYFSSRGHNSMGGYDVFKTVYDSSANSWSSPINLDFAVSTPDDDIFFMPDSGQSYAYFASKRNSPAGRVDVYKLRIDLKPVELAIIKGKVTSEVGGQSLDAKIIVKKAEGGEVVGEFVTNPKTGDYFVSVPNGGRFTFEVSSPDFSNRSELVVVPTQYELRTLRQAIALKPSKLQINNFFDEVLSDEDSKAAAMAFLKEKAKLEVNYSDTQTPVASQETKTTSEEIPNDPVVSNESKSNTGSSTSESEKPKAKFSNQELVDIAKEDAADARKEAEELQDKSDNANFASKKIDEEAQTKLTSANEIEASASALTDPVQKEEELKRASLLKKEAELLAKESDAVKALAQGLYKESQQKFKEAKENEKYAEELDKAVKSNSAASILKLTEQRAALETAAQDQKANDYGLAQVKEEAANKQEASEKATKELENLKASLVEAENEQKTIRDQVATTKSKKEKQALNQQADLLTPDIEEKRKEVEVAQNKADLLAEEAAAANSQVEIFAKVLGGSTADDIASSAGSDRSSSTSSESLSAPVTSESAIDVVNKANEDRISSITQKPDTKEKQTEIAAAYDKWAAELQREADSKKAELKKEKDPAKRSAMADAIMAIENASSEKMALASDARAKADELASGGNQVLNNEPENKTEPQAGTAGQTTLVISSREKVEEVNTNFAKEISSTDALTSEAEKDKAKVAILDNWVKALNERSSEIKTAIAASVNEDEKKALQEQQVLVEKQITEKQSQASLAFARAERNRKLDNEVAVLVNTPAGRDAQYSVEYEKQIKSANTISSAVAKEEAKAQIYAKWVEDIRNEKEILSQAAEKAGNESSRDALKEKINNLDQFQNEQSTLEASSRRSSQELAAGKDPVVNTSQNVPANESSSVTSNASQNEVPAELASLNTKYTDQLNSVDTISDLNIKNTEKKKLLNDWSAQLTSASDQYRTEAAGASGEDSKKLLLAKADKLSLEAAAKQKEAASLAATSDPVATSDPSKSDRPNNSITENTAGVSTTASAPEPVQTERYKGLVSTIDSKTNSTDLEKAEEKRRVYDNWSRDIEKQIAWLKKEKDSSADQARKDSITTLIADLEKESLEKQAQASLQVAKADRLRKQQEAAANSTAMNDPVAKVNEAQVNTGNSPEPVNDPVSKSNSDTQVIENNSENASASKEISKEVIAGLNESARLKFRSDSLRQAITNVPDQATRADMLAQSVVLERESYKARSIASQAMSAETNEEFRKNAAALAGYSTASERNMSDEVTMANMLVTESSYYNREAASIRETVKGSEPNSSVITVLERAEEYEKLAVEKQQKAIRLYQKGNPAYTYNGSGSSGSIASNDPSPVTSNASNKLNETNAGSANSVNNVKVFADTVSARSTGSDVATLNDPKIQNVSNPSNGNSTSVTSENDTTVKANSSSVGSVSNDTSKVLATARRYASATDSLNAQKISTESTRLETLAAKEEQEAGNYRTLAVKEKGIADSLTAEAAKPEKSSEKTVLEKEASLHSTLASQYESRADSVASLAVNSRAAAKARKEEAELLVLKNEPVEVRANNTTAENNSKVSTPSTSGTQGSNTTNKVSTEGTPEIPTDYLTETNELKREIFIAYAVNKAAYSSSKPIPINEKIPNGIIFKVQVGAFRNPIAPEVLKGFAPLMGETSPNGITRYTAGFFKVFENANNARKEINGMGYRDAFVVAFCNGKRIPVSEAQRLVREGKQCSGESAPVVAVNESTDRSSERTSAPVNNVNDQPVNTNSERAGSTAEQADQNSAPAVNVAVQQVKGLFYTVQVGVYSAKIPASKLKFVQPLFSEGVDNGLVRYSVGMYNDIALAKKARQIVLDYGITDAFVTAYVNGKRISVAEAGRLEQENGKTAFASDPVMNKMPEAGYGDRAPANRGTEPVIVPGNDAPVIVTNNTASIAPVNNGSSPASNAGLRTFKTVIPMSDTGLVFRVQIGAFKDEVPIEIASKFIRIADKGVNHYQSDSLTIYTVGGSRDYETAAKLKDIVSSEGGLTDAFVVAYRRGEKTPLEEAIKQSNIKY